MLVFNNGLALIKERLLNSLADLTTLCTFMSIGPVVRESASLIARGDLRELEHFRQFQTQAATMQCESIRWLYSVIPSIFKPTRPEQFQFLHKVGQLFSPLKQKNTHTHT